MSDLLTLKNRYKTIQSLDSVMNAMLIITAVKAQQAKLKFKHAVKYAEEIAKLAREICRAEVKRGNQDNLMIVVGTNKGLCGSFNEKVDQAVKAHMKSSLGKYQSYALGKLQKKFSEKYMELFAFDPDVIKNPDFTAVSKIAASVYQWFNKNQGNLFIAYNEYKSMMVQKPKVLKLLPVEAPVESNYLIEPSASALEGGLTLHYLESMIYKCVVESAVGELNTRMLVVKGATDNSNEMIADLKVSINKARQSAITMELSEIVSSFESLKGGEE